MSAPGDQPRLPHRGHSGRRDRPGSHPGRHGGPEAAAQKFGFKMDWSGFDWSCERYAKTGRMMPEDGIAQVANFDSLYLGAVGFPGVPDHVSLWGLLIPLRRELHQYVNVRPVRLLKGIVSPLVGRGPDDIDFMVVRENNEGEYSEIGGRMFRGTEDETALTKRKEIHGWKNKAVLKGSSLTARKVERKRARILQRPYILLY